MTETLTETITAAVRYCDANGIEIPLDLRLRAWRAGALKAGGSLDAIRAAYHDAITESLIDYFEGGSIVSSRNAFKRATVEAFGGAWDAGWNDDPPTDEALDWFNARVEQEFGHISVLFEQAKELRKDSGADWLTWTSARADGYTGTVDTIYNQARLFAAKDKMLTFDGKDGDANHVCQSINGTCVRLKGQRHRASWWIAHDLIPYPGNENFDCHCWNCSHFLRDDDGNRFTL